MIRLKRILFPTDFSECSKRAQEYACAFADQFQAELHLLHVLQDVGLMLPDPAAGLSLPPNYLIEQKQLAEKTLDALPSAEWARGKRLFRATRMGSPFVEIVSYAKEKEIDLIVIGTHGRSAIMHVLLGSVAEKVVRKAACPVLTVHPAGHQFVVP
jgi:nucleotide-binding universal stress UspA family protein